MYQIFFNRVVFKDFSRFSIVNYGVHFAIGFSLYLYVTYVLSYTLGLSLNPPIAATIAINHALGFVVGTKLHRLYYDRKLFWREPLEVLRRNGNSFYGGVFGLIFASWLTSIQFENVPFVTLLDLTFLSLPVFQLFIRTACASYGCCFGRPYVGVGAVTYSDGLSPAYRAYQDQAVHASQFYSMLKNITVFTVGLFLFLNFPSHGMAVACWFIFYSLLRFLVDFTRHRGSKQLLFGLRSSQHISMVIFAVGVFLLFNIGQNQYQLQFGWAHSAIQALHFSVILLPVFFFYVVIFGVSFVKQREDEVRLPELSQIP